MCHRKKGFTLIELLVVISIIAVLLSILMPALSKAKYLTNRIICLTRVKDQATSLMTYASANDGMFPENNGNGPQYHRSNIVPGGVEPVRVFDAMFGSYITNTDVMFCPLLKKLGGALDKRYYVGTSYAGWDIMEWSGISAQGANWDPSNGPPTYVVSSYTWFVNFREHPAALQVEFYDGEPPWPKNQETSSSKTAIITHEMSGNAAGEIAWDLSHGGDPSAWLMNIPVEEMGTDDSPVGYGDGSVIYHKKNEMKARADVSHGGTYVYYY